jgi:glycosyltransferase involved in cell wall biosynthesis
MSLLVVAGSFRPTPEQRAAHPRIDFLELAEATGGEALTYDDLPRRMRKLPRRAKAAAVAFVAFRRRRRHAVVYTTNEDFGLSWALLARLFRDRTPHIMVTFNMHRRHKRLLVKIFRLDRLVDRFVCYCTEHVNILRDEYGIPAEKIRMLPYYVDHEFFQPDEQPEEGQPSTLICGVGMEARDYGTLLAAIDGLDVDVRIAAGSPWSKWQNELEGQPLPPRVEMRYHAYPELRDLYASAQCTVVPLYPIPHAAGTTAALESMAMGKPVIISRNPWPNDWIQDGQNGYLIPPGSSSALHAALRRVLDDPAEAVRIGQAGRAQVEAEMTFDHHIARITSLMKEVSTR